MIRLSRRLVKSFLPKRPLHSHKGSFGRVLIVAGSARMAGAAVLCARGALQSGAGLVCLALPQSRQCVAAAAVPESLTVGLPEKNGVIAREATAQLTAFIEEFKPSVVLIGPGLSGASFIVPFLTHLRVPAVIDADALNALSHHKNWAARLPKNVPFIFTPHPAEMKRLMGGTISPLRAERAAQAMALSQKSGVVSVLKGFESIITDGHTVYVNPTGGPMLAKAGTGDVLGGMIAGLWAQLGTATAFDVGTALQAAATGVYLHGLCGELAAQQVTERCVLASEVAAQLPRAMKKVLQTK